jgi:hypothetical protein
MSLVALVRQPDIRAAFDSVAIKERPPAFLRDSALLVPDSGGIQGLAGTAFDLIARSQIMRDFRDRTFRLYVGSSVAEHTKRHVQMAAPSDKLERFWLRKIGAAQRHLSEYSSGGGDLQLVVDHAQYIARAEMAYRSGSVLDEDFQPIRSVSDELLRMIELLDPKSRYVPQAICILQPTFVESRWVGGADADLVIDNALIDLKTTKKLAIQVGNQMTWNASAQNCAKPAPICRLCSNGKSKKPRGSARP